MANYQITPIKNQIYSVFMNIQVHTNVTLVMNDSINFYCLTSVVWHFNAGNFNYARFTLYLLNCDNFRHSFKVSNFTHNNWMNYFSQKV